MTVAAASGARPMGTVHIVGAGPVGLFLAALLQGADGPRVRLYEQRAEYTRTRMVSLADYLTADSLDSYGSDPIDLQNVEAIFDADQLAAGMAYRKTVADDLRALLDRWTRGFVPLNTIEQSLSALIDTRATGTVERVAQRLDADAALAMLEPHDVLVDCTGTHSVTRDLLLPGEDLTVEDRNTMRIRLEHAIVVTFLYDQHYECNEYCKYYKNVDNPTYKFIPSVRRTHYDGSGTSRTARSSASSRSSASRSTSTGHYTARARRGGARASTICWRGARSSCSATPRSARPTSKRSRSGSRAPSSSAGTSSTAPSRSKPSSIATRRS